MAVSADRIVDMLARSEELRETCDEYETCLAAVERWRSAAAADHNRVEEFRAISRDLEAEIVRLLTIPSDQSP